MKQILHAIIDIDLQLKTYNKQIAELKAEKLELEEVLLNDMQLQGLQSMRIDGYTAYTATTTTPRCSDFNLLVEYAKTNNDFAIFTHNIRHEYMRELWADGKEVPGVEKFIKKTVHIRKL